MTNHWEEQGALHKMAIWKNYTAGDLSPLTSPLSHITDLLLHSDFDYYAPASGFPQNVTVPHASVAADPGTDISAGLGLAIAYTSVTDVDITLCAHGQSTVPNFMVSLNGTQYPGAVPIQFGGAGARRCVTPWADATNIYLRDSARPSSAGLAAITLVYKVTVFRASAVAGAKAHNFDAAAGALQMAYGKINVTEHPMRSPDTGDPIYYIPAGSIFDIQNGCVRWVLPDGTVYEASPVMGKGAYTGTFLGGYNVKQVYLP